MKILKDPVYLLAFGALVATLWGLAQGDTQAGLIYLGVGVAIFVVYPKIRAGRL